MLDAACALLGGLTADDFMRRHWQRRPLLVRRAIPDFAPPLKRSALFALAARDEVESRLVGYDRASGWSLRHGPFRRRALPPLGHPAWTLLVQGVDLHDDAARALLERFRFVPDARLDDLMISWASDGGGVGPHFDNYDVFLLQAQGRRRWRYGRLQDTTLDPGAPLKLLRAFAPTAEVVLDPGDMLYLPPLWAHEGVAQGGDCMTCSIGMRAPQRGELAGEIAQRLAETATGAELFRDRAAMATATPAAIPKELSVFAAAAVERLVAELGAIDRALGEILSEPKPSVWFERCEVRGRLGAVRLDRRSRMLYDRRAVFINGEAVPARGRDGALLRRLADERRLDTKALRGASAGLRQQLREWLAAGWLQRDG